MGWRLRYDKKVNVVTRVIPHLMGYARQNPNPLTSSQDNEAAIHFHYPLAREYVEELLRLVMKVPSLRCSRRHAFLNYAKLGILQQMPTIATAAPYIVLGRLLADRDDFLTRHRQPSAYLMRICQSRASLCNTRYPLGTRCNSQEIS